MLHAPFRLVRQSLPTMYAQGWGRVVNVSSAHGLRASAYKSAYVTAKHGLEGLSKVVALEGAPHGVTSNCINPGYVRTPLVESQIADQAKAHGIPEDEVVEKVMLEGMAVKRLVEPEEVAELAHVPLRAGVRVGHRGLVRDRRRVDGAMRTTVPRGVPHTSRRDLDSATMASRTTREPDGSGDGAALQLLRLLANSGTVAEITELDAPETERDLALRIREDFDRRRRREAELSALVETARDLASLSDPKGVLDAIVRRAPGAARHRPGLPHAVRPGTRRHLHAGHRRVDLGGVPVGTPQPG